ncbi:MAG: hypothetical protein ABGX07_12330, partial [Pirellulaceae bacterium]
AKNGYAAQLASNKRSTVENSKDIFLRFFGRLPSRQESDTAVSFVESEDDAASAYRSLLWSLLATNEFMFNH